MKKDDSLTICDISPKMLELAKTWLSEKDTQHLNINFKEDNAEELSSLKDKSFDIIIAHLLLNTVCNPDLALNSIAKKLKI